MVRKDLFAKLGKGMASKISTKRISLNIVNNRFGKRVSNGIWNAAPDSQL